MVLFGKAGCCYEVVYVLGSYRNGSITSAAVVPIIGYDTIMLRSFKFLNDSVLICKVIFSTIYHYFLVGSLW